MIDIGSVVNGKYRLVRLLGDGGMGAVYEAQHAMLGTRVAVKVLHPELGRRTGLVERFLQEARVAAQIRSPHVVQVTDVDRTADGYAYIVMELLEGEPLSSVLDRQHKLPVPIACDYAGQILSALEAAHALGVIHRDLKPENVFVTFAGGKPVLKLIDFGIAKARPTDVQQKKLTVAGVVMGTAEYMAPEQARSADRVDARSDLYAVGVLLYEMIAGARPVSGEDARVIALQVERGEVVPLVQVAPDTPREVAGLVHRAMAARPDLRFASATEMRLALLSAMGIKRASTAAPLVAKSGSTMELGAGHGPMAATRAMAPNPAASTPARRTPVGAAESEPHVNTIRAPPIATALTPSPYSGGTPMAAPVPPAPAGRPHRTRSATFALIALSLVLGAGLVALFVGLGARASSSSTRSAAAPPPEPSSASTPSATAPEPPSASALRTDVPSLAPTRPAAGPPVPPRAAMGGHAAVPLDGGVAAMGLPPGMASGLPPFPSALPRFPEGIPSGLAIPSAFPTALPSGFPTALPSGFPTALPSGFPSVPSGFPTALPSGFPSTLPGWPPPAPSSHAGASGDPAY